MAVFNGGKTLSIMKFYQCDCNTLIHEAQIGRKESSVHKLFFLEPVHDASSKSKKKCDMKSQDYFNYRAKISLFVLSAVRQLDLDWLIQLTVCVCMYVCMCVYV